MEEALTSYDKKFRANNIDQIIGNDSIKEYIFNIKKWPSSILLAGDTGCGKTTIARIIGKMRKSELVELNISNTRGIDNARSIIDSVQTHSLLGKGKTIVLNECHEATKHFQDAMLEILEEPPKGVMFVLCTTDPQKLLPAVRSRCVIHRLSRLNNTEAKELLKRIIRAEKLKIKKSLYRDIITAAEGIPRKLLLILDSIANITSIDQRKQLIKSYGYVEELASKETIDIARILLKGGSYKQIMALLKENQDSPETIRRMICSYMSNVLLEGQVNKRAAAVLDCFVYCDTIIGLPALVNSITIFYSEK